MISHDSCYLFYSLERNGKNSVLIWLQPHVHMYVIFLLHISTVTSMRRARYARKDLRSYSYVDEGPIDYRQLEQLQWLLYSCAAYMFIYIYKCQVNADASKDMYRLWECTVVPSSGRRGRKKNILNRLSLQHACTSRRNIHNGFII